MKHISSFFTFFIIFLAVSCGDDDPVKDDGGDNNPDTNSTKETYHDFYPMRVGTEWEHTVYIHKTEAYKFILKVDSMQIKGSDTIFYFNNTEEYVKKPDGLHDRDNRLDSFKLNFKYPVKKNEMYNYDIYQVVVKNIDTLISVPYGEFKCIHYFLKYISGKNEIAESEVYISKNIGIIKMNQIYIYENGDTSHFDGRLLSNYKY